MQCVILFIVICAIAPVYLYPSSKVSVADHKPFHPYQHHYQHHHDKRETKGNVVAKNPKPGKPRGVGVGPYHLGDTKSNGCISNFYKDPNGICRQQE